MTNEEFFLLRTARDVIRMGTFKMWDAGPGHGCPIQDEFFRRSGLRVFSNRYIGQANGQNRDYRPREDNGTAIRA